MSTINSIFVSNLKKVFGGLKPYSWGSSLNISNATISRMLEGKVPGEELLSHISKVSGVSLSWLLLDKGARYPIHNQSEEDLAHFIEQNFNEITEVYFITDQRRLLLSFFADATTEFKNKEIEYKKLTRHLIYPTKASIDLIEKIHDKVTHLAVVTSKDLDEEAGRYLQFGQPSLVPNRLDDMKALIKKCIEMGNTPELETCLSVIFDALELEGINPEAVAKTVNQLIEMKKSSGQAIHAFDPSLVKTLYNGNS